MLKKLIVGGLVLVGVAAFVKRRMGRGYEEDDLDTEDFGTPSPAAMATATPQASPTSPLNATPPDPAGPSVAAAAAAIHFAWSGVSEDEVASAGEDRDRLAALIAAKMGEPQGRVRLRLDSIIAEATRANGKAAG